MSYQTTVIDSYHIKSGVLRAWLNWRFKDAELEPLVKAQDGYYQVYATEKLTQAEKSWVMKQLKNQGEWTAPEIPWQEWWGAYCARKRAR